MLGGGGGIATIIYGVFPAVDDVYACGQSLCGVANVASVQVEHFHGLLVCGIVLDGLDAYAEQFLPQFGITFGLSIADTPL